MEIKATSQGLPFSFNKGDIELTDQDSFAALISALLSNPHLPMQQQNLLQELKVMEDSSIIEGQGGNDTISLLLQSSQSQRDIVHQGAPEQNQDQLTKLLEVFKELIKEEKQLGQLQVSMTEAGGQQQQYDIVSKVQDVQISLNDVNTRAEVTMDEVVTQYSSQNKTLEQNQPKEEAQVTQHKLVDVDIEVQAPIKTAPESEHQTLINTSTQKPQPQSENKVQLSGGNETTVNSPKEAEVIQQSKAQNQDTKKQLTNDETIYHDVKRESDNHREDQSNKIHPLNYRVDETKGSTYGHHNSNKGLDLEGQTEETIGINLQQGTQQLNDQTSISKEQPSLSTAVVFKDQDMAHIVTERFKALRLPEITEIKVKLKPEDLGDVLIKVTLEKGEIKGSIFADKQETYLIIQKQIDHIKQGLQNSNLNLNSLNVFINSDGGNNQNPSRQFSNQNRKSKQDFGQLVEEITDKKEEGLSIIA